jgi:hypothetical protein
MRQQPQHGRYQTINTIPVFSPLLQLLQRYPWWGQPVTVILIARYSTPGEGPGEQLAKVAAIHRSAVPDIGVLLERVPEDAWNLASLRAAHDIAEIRVRDVTDERFPDDRNGSAVIGYLTQVGSMLVFRVASSGFKTMQMHDGESRNPYTQAVIELLKVIRASFEGVPLDLRISEDPTRKGRLAVELTRLDEWVQRLGVRVFQGAAEPPAGEYARLISAFHNTGAELDRRTTVDHTTKGTTHSSQRSGFRASPATSPTRRSATPRRCHLSTCSP